MTNCHHYDSINIQVKSHEYQRLRRIEKAAVALVEAVKTADDYHDLDQLIDNLKKATM